jgi:hypothetical protein
MISIKQFEVETGYILVMNPIYGKAEQQVVCGQFETHQEALDFHDSLIVEPYMDGHYRKSFKQGSPLELMNPLSHWERYNVGTFGHGIHKFESVIRIF